MTNIEEFEVPNVIKNYVDDKITSDNIRETLEYFWDKYPKNEVFHHTEGATCYMYIFDRENDKEKEIDDAVEHILENYILVHKRKLIEDTIDE